MMKPEPKNRSRLAAICPSVGCIPVILTTNRLTTAGNTCSSRSAYPSVQHGAADAPLPITVRLAASTRLGSRRRRIRALRY